MPRKETKGTTCMLMHCGAFRERGAAEAEGMKCADPLEKGPGL